METLINIFYEFTGDLGLSVIGVTLLVKLILLPLSIGGRKSSLRQQKIANKMEEVKKKFSKNKRRMEKELEELQGENLKSMKGCLLQFIQIPIISMMYMGISNIQIEGATMIVPWVSSIKISDQLFIIPIIYVAVTLFPIILGKVRKDKNQLNPIMSVVMVIFSLVIIIKAPIGLGLYFITSSLFSLIEGEAFRVYSLRASIAN